jgi:carboxypeptidase family protein
MIARALVAALVLLPAAAAAHPLPRPSSGQAARDNPPPTGTAIVRGRVVAAATEHGLAKVTVRAVSPSLRVNKAVLTDASGRYEITELPAGRYSISATKINYVPTAHGQLRPLGPGRPIDVANGAVVDHVDVALQRTGAISGKIVDEFGDPAEVVQVAPMRYMFFNGERRLQMAGPSSMTNDLGEYRLFGLFPGQYYVSATLRNNNFGSESTEATAYAPTFFPGTGSSADAQKLIVAAGQTLSGIDITLIPVVAARVSGTALDTLGRPLANARVDLMLRAGFVWSEGRGTWTRPDGTFVISGVPPGEYTLQASLQGQQDEYALADVTVAGGDVSGVQLVATKTTPIRGRIVFEPGKAKPPTGPAVRVTAVRPFPMLGVPGTTTGREDGSFELKTASGNAHIRAALLGNGDWRLSHVLVNGVDVIDTGLDIPAGGSVDNVIVELTSRHTEISGSVVDGAGDRVRDCVVVVFAQDSQRWTGPTRYVVATRPDLEGVLHARVPAGDYYAVAFEHPEPQVPTDPDVLAQLRDRAIPISIGDGETKALELKLSQPPVY